MQIKPKPNTRSMGTGWQKCIPAGLLPHSLYRWVSESSRKPPMPIASVMANSK